MRSIVIHYKELALKGRNRPWFVQLLVRNLRTALRGLDVSSVRTLMGRIQVDLGPAADVNAVSERIRRVFGIANFSLAGTGPLDFPELARRILADLGDRSPASFRVSARRADKRFPMTSPQIEREVGGLIKIERGWHVDLRNAELTVHLELLHDHAFYFFAKDAGAGGLPTGASGKLACLLSGGIDSPVAAYRMMRRGCTVSFIHFHSYPILSRASQEKVREIATLLTTHQLHSRLALVAFGEIQQQVVLAVPPELRVVIYRRLMVRIAERLARRWRARALVTGEVVGQVASQTLENMTTIADVSGMEILRPLVGMDKDEIADQADAIGTLAISNIPDQDCCTLFTPRHPATRARLDAVQRAETALPIDDMVATAVATAVIEEFVFPAARESRRARAPRKSAVETDGVTAGPTTAPDGADASAAAAASGATDPDVL